MGKLEEESNGSNNPDVAGVMDESSPFECNVCLDLAKDPVVTVCGHLYCWRCLYRWSSEQVGT